MVGLAHSRRSARNGPSRTGCCSPHQLVEHDEVVSILFHVVVHQRLQVICVHLLRRGATKFDDATKLTGKDAVPLYGGTPVSTARTTGGCCWTATAPKEVDADYPTVPMSKLRDAPRVLARPAAELAPLIMPVCHPFAAETGTARRCRSAALSQTSWALSQTTWARCLASRAQQLALGLTCGCCRLQSSGGWQRRFYGCEPCRPHHRWLGAGLVNKAGGRSRPFTVKLMGLCSLCRSATKTQIPADPSQTGRAGGYPCCLAN